MKVLVTGGAGFIGSHIVETLLEKGHEVRILDNLERQVHGKKKPPHLLSILEHKNVEFLYGDVAKRPVWKSALDGVEAVIHDAAMVGVGQSMYQIDRYLTTNIMGTSHLLDFLVNKEHTVKKLILAASMSSYGEGAYHCEHCGDVQVSLRTEQQLSQKIWEHHCPHCRKQLTPIPTKETHPQQPTSVYALSKKHQEEYVLLIGKTYGIPTTTLRYFNVYGPRQSLSNPYTGVAAIFLSRLKNNNPPIVFEDGLQTRDFIHVKDVAAANVFALEHSITDYHAINVGSGIPRTIKSIAETLSRILNKPIPPTITHSARKGDVRHCFADTTKLKSFGFCERISFETGMAELVQWSVKEHARDTFDRTLGELKKHNLFVTQSS